MFWSGRGWDSHQWRTLQMFLELSEASCWNVFPPHEETRAATLLAAPTGSRDPGHVTEENLTSGFGSWPSLLRSSQPGHWSEARGRQEATVSHIKRLEPPTHKGIRSLQARRYSTVDRLRSLTQMDTHTHVHASAHMHISKFTSCKTFFCSFSRFATFLSSLYIFRSLPIRLNRCSIGNDQKNKVDCSWFAQKQLDSKWFVVTERCKHL